MNKMKTYGLGKILANDESKSLISKTHKQLNQLNNNNNNNKKKNQKMSRRPTQTFLQRRLSLSLCVCVQSCPTEHRATDCSPPGSSVHGIFQARILEQVAISYSRGSS